MDRCGKIIPGIWRFWSRRLGSGTVIALLLGLAAQVQGQTGGEALVLMVQGAVQVQPAGSEEWLAARTNQVLKVGDRLRTGPQSRAQIRLSTLALMPVAESSTVQIEASEERETTPLFQRGSFSIFSRDKPLKYRTRLASGATRGTEFHVFVGEEKEEITVFEGAVEVQTAQGSEVVAPNEQVELKAGSAPIKARGVEAVNVLQWVLHYPAVLDVDELEFSREERNKLEGSIEAYRAGDVIGALNALKGEPASTVERVYFAALALAAGSVERAQQFLASIDGAAAGTEQAWALKTLLAAVKLQEQPASEGPVTSASGNLAESYYRQSKADLVGALAAAERAVEKNPEFGFGWIRVAEMEFSFGRTPKALAALKKGLELAPRAAQGHSLEGYLLAAEGKIKQAIESFNRALELDGSLGAAWLGRGMCRIRNGDSKGGRENLQVAAALEPQRSIYRSYLGKAFSNVGDFQKATQELERARELDKNDPTPWLYSALLNRRKNRINEAIRDLEKSRDLNDNNAIFRSEFLLDQDRAVRSANLAAIYDEAGMQEVAVREASRALVSDYANFSAHLFLATAYNVLSDPYLDPRQSNLRYETPAVNEFLLANLLAPAGAGVLGQNIGQMQYSRLFDQDGVGLTADTVYQSNGSWLHSGSQYGRWDNFSYGLDWIYRDENGDRINGDYNLFSTDLKLKAQITPRDGLYFETVYAETDSGDQTLNYFNRGSDLRLRENLDPIVLGGYHREWTPGSHTLFLAGRLHDSFRYQTSFQPVSLFALDGAGEIGLSAPAPFDPTIPPPISAFANRGQIEIYTAELQHIWQKGAHTLVGGGRYQIGDFVNRTRLAESSRSEFGTESSVFALPPFGIRLPVTSPALEQRTETDFYRLSFYLYETWRVLDPVRITGGFTYDRLHHPLNRISPPFSSEEETTDQLSPKAGLIWDITKRTTLRSSYSTSLGGVSFDQSFRLEPSLVGGFNQAYRSLIPDAVAGPQTAPEFETASVGLDHRFTTGTYAGVEAELLQSEFDREIGAFAMPGFAGAVPMQLHQELEFRERSLLFTLDQLLGDYVSAGVRFRISEADFSWTIPQVPASVNAAAARSSFSSTLKQLNPYAVLNLPCGFFASADSLWTEQNNREAVQGLRGDDFWQHNIFAGYRFLQRRAEITVGILNVTDQDYKLHPLNIHAQLPRERTFVARTRFSF